MSDKNKDTSVLSYNRFLIDRKKFQRAGTQNSDEFNLYDTPAHKYFKIFFYFGTNANGAGNINGLRDFNNTNILSGLLAPSWHENYISKIKEQYQKDNNIPIPLDETLIIDEYKPDLSHLNTNYSSKDIISISNINATYDAAKNIVNKFQKIAIEAIDKRTLSDYPYINNSNFSADDKVKFLAAAKARDKENLIKQYKEEQASIRISALEKIYDKYKKSRAFDENRYIFNDAYSYLTLNGEYDAADNLKNFIELLSNISIKSPWYFTNVNGVQEALERKQVDTGKIEALDERRKLTISCLPDAFDNRIDTLLELYRSCTWDWKNKREIIPANLRKFDMAIYIFEAPDQLWHKDSIKAFDSLGDKWKNAAAGALSNLNADTALNRLENQITEYTDINNFSKFTESNKDNIGFCPSFKLIEFHDCEFGYNSVKSAWTELNNQTGMSPTYTIEITYGDCYDLSYNDLLIKAIGDGIFASSAAWDEKQEEHIQKRMMAGADANWLLKLGVGAANRLSDKALGFVKQVAYGNLYGLSLTNVLSDIGNAIQDPMSAYDSIMKYASNGKEMAQQMNKQASSLVNNVKRTAVNSVNMKQFQAEYSKTDADEQNNYSSAAVNPAGIVKTSREEFKTQENMFSDTGSNTDNVNSFGNIAERGNRVRGVRVKDVNEHNTNSAALNQSLFEAYLKNKVIKNNSGLGNLYKSTSVANNL